MPIPSSAQAEAGNYRKKHVRWQGWDVSIETPKGDTRRASDGSWEVKNFPADYGYIRRTEGADGEQIDLYLGSDYQSPMVWVVDQVDAKSKKFDEHKVMAGFKSRSDAVKAYRAGFSDGKADDRMGSVNPMTLTEFKRWVDKGDTTRPVDGEFAR